MCSDTSIIWKQFKNLHEESGLDKKAQLLRDYKNPLNTYGFPIVIVLCLLTYCVMYCTNTGQ